MSVADWKPPLDESTAEESPSLGYSSDHTSEPRLHRVQTIRKQQGMSLRSVARRLGMTVEQVRAQEDETTDLPLSALYAWRDALDVPIANLLADLDGPISEPVLKRARLLKLMKTAASLSQIAKSDQVQRLAAMLIDQLIELMPELKDVSPWHSVGQRRTLREFGRIVERQLPDGMFAD